MAEKFRIAQLDIDTKALLTGLEKTKTTIDELTQTQKELKKAGDTSSKTFIENDAKLKGLRKEYNSQIKVLQETSGANAKLTEELKKEVKSLDGAKNNNKELRKVRNQINTATEEGAKQVAEINNKIDQNTEYIKNNTSALERQKQNIGNYPTLFGRATKGVKAFGLALKAMGIGLITAAIAGLSNAFGKNQRAMNILSTVANAFSIVFNDIVDLVIDSVDPVTKFFKSLIDDPQKKLKEFGDLIKENLTERFESFIETTGLLGKAIKQLFDGDFEKAFETAKQAGKEAVDIATGVDDSYNKIGNGISDAKDAIIKYGEEVTKTAIAQTKLENTAKIAEAQNRILVEQYDRQAEKLRQIRDNDSLNIADRISANKELGVVLEDQEKAMIAQANAIVASAQAQYSQNQNTDNYVALLDAQAEKEGILAQVEGFRSEQIVNQTQLIKERGKISEEEKQKELEQVQAFEDKRKELENAIEEQKLKDEQEKEELRIEREFEKHTAELERLTLNEQQKTELIKLLEQDRNLQLAEVNDNYRQEQKEGEKELQQAKIDARKQTLDKILALTNEETAIGKAALIAKQALALREYAINSGLFQSKIQQKTGEAIADTASGVSKTASSAPFPFNIPLIAGFIGQTVGLVSTIKSAIGKDKKPKFARGGILKGASHANGGIQTPYGEMEGGEAIINKRSTSLFGGLLSSINQAGGGKKFADGGITGTAKVTRSFIDYDLLASKISIANSSLPSPIVDVQEINSVSNRVRVIEDGANF